MTTENTETTSPCVQPARQEANTDARVSVYGRNAAGGRNIGVALPSGTSVLIYSGGEAEDKSARELADRIVDGERALEVLRAERDQARSQRNAALAEASRLDRSLRSAISGRRRFFGPVLCRPAGTDWSGPVWLLDPKKQERGLGLRFESLADLRQQHPELWPVGTLEGGVLLDASTLPTAIAFEEPEQP